MPYGDGPIRRGMRGDDVQELQIRLAGFRGTVPDGVFGPGTELQVMEFQRQFMAMAGPTGIADIDTLRQIDVFADRFPIDFSALRCPCGVCGGFGRQQFKNEYLPNSPQTEAFHRYEYPGIHRMILWAARAAFFLMPEYGFAFTSGYRCSEDNRMHDRTTTNHHGKAVDFDVVRPEITDKQADMTRCDLVRGKLVQLSNAQVGWAAPNRKALEPSNIAPTWVHYDVRCYERRYLEDRFFCTTLETLNGPQCSID